MMMTKKNVFEREGHKEENGQSKEVQRKIMDSPARQPVLCPLDY